MCRYFGVLYALQKLGVVTPGVTPIGGVSGGSVAAASSCLGLDFPSQVGGSSCSSSNGSSTTSTSSGSGGNSSSNLTTNAVLTLVQFWCASC
jgi:hypothetical protein